jgi:flagellar biogenesis protein FliO
MFAFGAVLVIVIILITLLPRVRQGNSNPTPTPSATVTPILEQIVYEDDKVKVIKIKDKLYEAEVKDVEATEGYIREKAKLKSDDVLKIILIENILPPLDSDGSYQEEVNQNLDEFNKREEEQFDPEEWGLNPNHSE